MRKLVFFALAAIFLSCNESAKKIQFFSAENQSIKYSGRHATESGSVALIGSASSVQTKVYGDSVALVFESPENHHYVAVELNDKYLGRYRVKNDTLSFGLPNKDAANGLKVYKDTEAANSDLIFIGLQADKIEAPSEEDRLTIEFIGNSITCGMGADSSKIGCDEEEWYDQHNAYMAYGPRVARALKANFRLNCVSGMGMYRNWNDEDQPVMPNVYDNKRLNADSNEKADFSGKSPEIVSIALGTNDLSYGDGEKERKAFDQEKFVNNYIDFVKHIFKLYPNTQVALLSSPMVGEKEKPVLEQSLEEVKSHFENNRVAVFKFDTMNLQGCGNHPNLQDHREMAQALIPFYRNLLSENTIE
ncbi:MAG: GDSL-type esterase/lipase family protein [Salinimicrobium sp.]